MPLKTPNNVPFIDAEIYGLDTTGVNDSTPGITAAISAATGGILDGTNTLGGEVHLPRGTILYSGLIMYSYVHLVGSGISATTLKLANGANADCVQGYNAPSLIGGSTNGGIVNWSIRNLTIDGNKSNQSSTSYGIRFYGYGFILQNLRVRNTFSDSLRSDWNGGSTSGNDSMEAQVINCKFHDTGAGAIGFNWTGPHDSSITNVLSYKTGSHAFYIGPNATGMLFTNCHGWGMTQGVGGVSWLVEATGFQASNCVAEGSDSAQLVIMANKFSWVGGSIFDFGVGNPTWNVTGAQIGQIASATLKSAATASPIVLTALPTTVSLLGSQLQFVVSGASGFPGTIVLSSGTNFAGTTIGETINVSGNGTFTSTNFYVGAPTITVNTITGYSINVVGLGNPYPGSTKQSAGVTTAAAPVAYVLDSLYSQCEGVNGSVWFANDGGNGFVRGPVSLSNDANANKVLTGVVANTTSVYLIPNGTTADGTLGKGGQVKIPVNSTKAFLVTDGTSDIINANTNSKRLELPNAAVFRQYSDNYSTRTVEISNGTISMLQSTSAAATASSGTITTSGVGIARVAPTGNITAVILQAGTLAGQKVIVRNESAFTITFDVAGTSHVADGATSAIPANCSREFEWNSVGSVWSRMA